MSNDTAEKFVPVRRAASRLGVPGAWLAREAREGRVPCLRVGRRLMVNPAVVEQVLAERAAAPAEPGAREGVNRG